MTGNHTNRTRLIKHIEGCYDCPFHPGFCSYNKIDNRYCIIEYLENVSVEEVQMRVIIERIKGKLEFIDNQISILSNDREELIKQLWAWAKVLKI